MESTKVKKQTDILSYLCRCSQKARNGVIQSADKALIDCLSECALNILHGNVPLTEEQKKKLKRHKRKLRALSFKRVPVNYKKEMLQSGGFLGALLGPLAATVLTPVVSSVVEKVLK